MFTRDHQTKCTTFEWDMLPNGSVNCIMKVPLGQDSLDFMKYIRPRADVSSGTARKQYLDPNGYR